MKNIFTLIALAFISISAISQTTEYTTGQTYSDPWTGWSTPVTTGISSSSVNGVDIYAFSGTDGMAFTAEISRQFTINSNDLDLYFSATTQNATVSIEFSTDDITYTEIATQDWAAGYSQSTIVLPTFDPGVSTFYLKLKITGTMGSPSQAQFNSLKIDAVLNTSGVEDFELGSNVFYSNGELSVLTSLENYTVNIYDITGKLIISEANLKSYNFNSMNQGLYFASFISEGERKTLKIVHQNL